MHLCHLPGCSTPTPRRWLFCKPHWFAVPADLRRQVLVAYNKLPHAREGYCLRLSHEYIEAVKAAIAAVLSGGGHAQKEKKTAPVREPADEFCL